MKKEIEELKKIREDVLDKINTLNDEELKNISGGNGMYGLEEISTENMFIRETDEWHDDIKPTEVGRYEIYMR